MGKRKRRVMLNQIGFVCSRDADGEERIDGLWWWTWCCAVVRLVEEMVVVDRELYTSKKERGCVGI